MINIRQKGFNAERDVADDLNLIVNTCHILLKMFHMSRKDEAFAEVIGGLNLVPVSISYEYDPCDQAKARDHHEVVVVGDREDANRLAVAFFVVIELPATGQLSVAGREVGVGRAAHCR